MKKIDKEFATPKGTTSVVCGDIPPGAGWVFYIKTSLYSYKKGTPWGAPSRGVGGQKADILPYFRGGPWNPPKPRFWGVPPPP